MEHPAQVAENAEIPGKPNLGEAANVAEAVLLRTLRDLNFPRLR